MKARTKILLFCLLSFAFVGCDQVTKDLAKTHLSNGEPTSFFHDTFRLEYAENTGAALNLGANLPQPYNFWLLSFVPILFLSALFWYAISHIRGISLLQLLAFSLIVSGGVGNIIDRVFRDRHVTDFMNVGFQNIRTGIFNVADVCITVGVIAVFVSYQSATKI